MSSLIRMKHEINSPQKVNPLSLPVVVSLGILAGAGILGYLGILYARDKMEKKVIYGVETYRLNNLFSSILPYMPSMGRVAEEAYKGLEKVL